MGDLKEGERNGKRETELIAPPLAPVPVADMKMLLVGKECPHTKEKSSGKQNKVSTSYPILSSWRWVLGVGGWWQVVWFHGQRPLGSPGVQRRRLGAAPALNPTRAGRSPAEKPAIPCAVPVGCPGVGLLHCA